MEHTVKFSPDGLILFPKDDTHTRKNTDFPYESLVQLVSPSQTLARVWLRETRFSSETTAF